MKNLFLCVALMGCGTTFADYYEPTYAITVEACNIAQRRAVERAETEAEAVARVAEIRDKCDVAFRGLETSAELAEVLED